MKTTKNTLARAMRNLLNCFKFFFVFLSVAAIDQLTKLYVIDNFVKGSSKVIVPKFFYLTHVGNTGSAWGLFENGALYLGIFGVVAIFSIALYALIKKESVLSLSLLCGGILGNTIDRFRLGAVVDFLDFRIFGYKWPAFNFADIIITIVIIFFIFFKRSSS